MVGIHTFIGKNSIAHSVESRVPFLDHQLLEFAVNIPTEQKIHGALTKIILREAMKNYLPGEVYDRTDKIGFRTPIEKNLIYERSHFYKFGIDYINKSELNRLDLLDKKAVNNNNIFGIYALTKFINAWN